MLGWDQQGGWSSLVSAFPPSFKTQGFSFLLPWMVLQGEGDLMSLLGDAPEAAVLAFLHLGDVVFIGVIFFHWNNIKLWT